MRWSHTFLMSAEDLALRVDSITRLQVGLRRCVTAVLFAVVPTKSTEMTLGTAFPYDRMRFIEPDQRLVTTNSESKRPILTVFPETNITTIDPMNRNIPDESVFNVAKRKNIPSYRESSVIVTTSAVETNVLETYRTDHAKASAFIAKGIV